MPLDGLDGSWVLALNWAVKSGLRWGSDIVFTYGPYYFLAEKGPMFFLSGASFLLQNLLILLLNFIVTFILSKELFGIFQKGVSYKILAGIGLFILISSGSNSLLDKIMVSVILIITEILFKKIGNRFWSIICMVLAAFLIAISSLAITRYLFTGLIFYLLFIIISGIRRRFFDIILFSGSLLVSLLVLWMIAGQKPGEIPNYLLNGYLISTGYSEAMSTFVVDIANSHGYFMLIILSITALAGIFLLLKRKTYFVIPLFLIGPVLFLAYKEGIVRNDEGHYLAFYLQLWILFVYLIILINYFQIKNPYLHLGLFFTFATAVSVLHPQILPVANYDKILNRLGENKEQILITNRGHIKWKYNDFPESFAKTIGDQSVDVFPWDISLLYGYKLNWKPRPVFQSYQAYTSILDGFNERFYQQQDAPEYVIYSFKDLDGLYPLYYEPKTLRALLDNYRIVDKNPSYLLLSKQNDQELTNVTHINGGNTNFNQDISIPYYPFNNLYINLDIKMSPIGRLVDLFYKSPPLFIEIFVKGSDEPFRYRIRRDLGNNSFFISKHVNNLAEVGEIFNESYWPNVEKIRISPESSYLFFEQYRSEFKYEVFSVPFKYSHTIYDNLEFSTKSNLKVVVEQSSYSNHKLFFKGWAYNPSTNRSYSFGKIVFKSKNNTRLEFPVVREFRTDISSPELNITAMDIGWNLIISDSNLPDGNYDVFFENYDPEANLRSEFLITFLEISH